MTVLDEICKQREEEILMLIEELGYFQKWKRMRMRDK